MQNIYAKFPDIKKFPEKLHLWNENYATMTSSMQALYEVFQSYMVCNYTKIMHYFRTTFHILSITNADWLQHTGSVRKLIIKIKLNSL